MLFVALLAGVFLLTQGFIFTGFIVTVMAVGAIINDSENTCDYDEDDF